MRLIDADKIPVVEDHENGCEYDFAYLYDIINMPTIDAKPVVHARWVGDDKTMKCTHCRRRIAKNLSFRYCPICGAKMDLKEG